MAELQKVLSFRTILLITLNAVMGTGIFFLPALGAREAGPASIASWLGIAVLAIAMAAIFGELTSMFPTAGGVYEFCKNAFNGFWAFMIGWVTFITGNVTIAMLIIGAIEYLAPVDLPVAKIGIAMGFILIFHGIAYMGMKTSGTMLVAFAFITLITLLAIIIPGLWQVDWNNFTPFLPFASYGVLILAGVAIMETFFGWETATFLAGETKNGERAVPWALIISTTLTTIIALLVTIVGMGIIPWQIFGTLGAPINAVAEAIYGPQAIMIFSIMVYLALIGSVAGWIVASPRLILSMAQDKLFLSQLAAVHPKFNSPYKAIIFQGCFVAILVLISSAAYETILHILLPLAVIQYAAVILALIVLRFKRPGPRIFTFRPGIPGALLVMLGLFGVLGYWILHDGSAFKSFQLAASIIFLGIPVYFLLKVYYDPDAVIKLNDTFAGLAFLTERFSLPKRVRNEILTNLGELKGKSVLEFGNSIGTLTVDIAKHVSPQGKVYATNISKKELSISERRVLKNGHQHVVFIHDQHQANRVHPQIPDVDSIVSFGMLSYLQDVKKVLTEMGDILKPGGNILLVDWVNFFHFIPDVEWLTKDAKIKETFNDCGFAVTITRRKGLFWDYLYIHGYKTKEGAKNMLFI